MRYVQHLFDTRAEAESFARALDRPDNHTEHCQMIVDGPPVTALIRDNAIDTGPNVQKVEHRASIEAECADCGAQIMVPPDEDPANTLCVGCADDRDAS